MGPGIVRGGQPCLPPEGAGGVPALCPRLASLLGDEGSEPSARLLQVALRVGAHSLDADRFRLLFLAWGLGDSLEDIRRVVGAPSPEAVRHRLRRLSDAVECAIAEELARQLPEPDRRRWMHVVLEKRDARCRPGEAFLAAVSAAFDAIAARAERTIRKQCKSCK